MASDHLRALAARALAEEPSRELRGAIWAALGWTQDGQYWQHKDTPNSRQMFEPDNPLTSHDAAFGAMPAGWRVRTGWLDDGSFYAFSRHADHDDTVHANAPTLPRAVTAAGLMARAVEMDASNG